MFPERYFVAIQDGLGPNGKRILRSLGSIYANAFAVGLRELVPMRPGVTGMRMRAAGVNTVRDLTGDDGEH